MRLTVRCRSSQQHNGYSPPTLWALGSVVAIIAPRTGGSVLASVACMHHKGIISPPGQRRPSESTIPSAGEQCQGVVLNGNLADVHHPQDLLANIHHQSGPASGNSITHPVTQAALQHMHKMAKLAQSAQGYSTVSTRRCWWHTSGCMGSHTCALNLLGAAPGFYQHENPTFGSSGTCKSAQAQAGQKELRAWHSC